MNSNISEMGRGMIIATKAILHRTFPVISRNLRTVTTLPDGLVQLHLIAALVGGVSGLLFHLIKRAYELKQGYVSREVTTIEQSPIKGDPFKTIYQPDEEIFQLEIKNHLTSAFEKQADELLKENDPLKMVEKVQHEVEKLVKERSFHRAYFLMDRLYESIFEKWTGDEEKDLKIVEKLATLPKRQFPFNDSNQFQNCASFSPKLFLSLLTLSTDEFWKIKLFIERAQNGQDHELLVTLLSEKGFQQEKLFFEALISSDHYEKIIEKDKELSQNYFAALYGYIYLKETGHYQGFIATRQALYKELYSFYFEKFQYSEAISLLEKCPSFSANVNLELLIDCRTDPDLMKRIEALDRKVLLPFLNFCVKEAHSRSEADEVIEILETYDFLEIEKEVAIWLVKNIDSKRLLATSYATDLYPYVLDDQFAEKISYWGVNRENLCQFIQLLIDAPLSVTMKDEWLETILSKSNYNLDEADLDLLLALKTKYNHKLAKLLFKVFTHRLFDFSNTENLITLLPSITDEKEQTFVARYLFAVAYYNSERVVSERLLKEFPEIVVSPEGVFLWFITLNLFSADEGLINSLRMKIKKLPISVYANFLRLELQWQARENNELRFIELIPLYKETVGIPIDERSYNELYGALSFWGSPADTHIKQVYEDIRSIERVEWAPVWELERKAEDFLS